MGFFKEMIAGDSPIYRESVPRERGSATIYPPDDVIQYLNAGYPILDVMEGTVDVIGGAFQVPGGSSVLSDGVFVWRMDLAFYVRQYEIPLPVDFVTFMRENDFAVPRVTQGDLIEISTAVTNQLGFRAAPGAAPRS
ncbi:hypothetical protein [Streptomyces sp. NPDC059076]|uniref:hypothetical protein n=1 Tax=unclassified Streptomyces TaxID=2593676 RepID=UPI0036B28511